MHVLLGLLILISPLLLLWGLWHLFVHSVGETVDAARQCCEEIHDRPVHVEGEIEVRVKEDETKCK